MLFVRCTKWNREQWHLAFVSAMVEVRRKCSCTTKTNPATGTRKRDNPLWRRNVKEARRNSRDKKRQALEANAAKCGKNITHVCCDSWSWPFISTATTDCGGNYSGRGRAGCQRRCRGGEWMAAEAKISDSWWRHRPGLRRGDWESLSAQRDSCWTIGKKL